LFCFKTDKELHSSLYLFVFLLIAGNIGKWK
jgi:hypothetical protein